MILTGSLASPHAVERFYTEARAAAKLNHPNIVSVHEVGQIGGQHFYSMEYVEGKSLDDLIREGTLFKQAIARFVHRIAIAIHYAHEQRVLHRDLKPSNVLVDEQGEPQVTDFGLAKRTDEDSELTRTEQVMGTPSYMSPEQARGASKTVGPTSDVYSLGALIYALLTGRPPFRAETAAETVVQVINDDPVLPSKLNPSAPRDLETICLKCLEKETTKRYSSARDLADDLGRYQRGEPIVARPVGNTERAWRWCKRNRLAAGLSAAVVLTLLIGTVVSTSFAILATRNSRLAQLETSRADTSANEARSQASLAMQNSEEAREARQLMQVQLRRAEDTRHAIQIEAAQRAWHRNDVAETERILSEIGARYKESWETKHLLTICKRKAMPLIGLTGQPISVFVSSDGKRVIGCSEEDIKVWDAETGEVIQSFEEHGRITSVGFSGNGKRVVGTSKDGAITTWDTDSGKTLPNVGKIVRKYGPDRAVRRVCVSHDGGRIVDIDGYEFRMLDAGSGKQKLAIRSDSPVSCVSISQDDKRIVSGDRGSGGSIQLWSIDTGKRLQTGVGHKAHVTALNFSHDGKRIVSGSYDRTIKVWDAETGKEVITLEGHTHPITSVCFSGNEKRIVSGGEDQRVIAWDAETGRLLFDLHAHLGKVQSVGVSHDGQRVVSCGEDKMIYVWNTESRQEKLALHGHSGEIRGVSFRNQGKQIVSSGRKSIKIWDVTTRRETHHLQEQYETPQFVGTRRVTAMQLSRDQKWIVGAANSNNPGNIMVWDAETGQLIRT